MDKDEYIIYAERCKRNRVIPYSHKEVERLLVQRDKRLKRIEKLERIYNENANSKKIIA